MLISVPEFKVYSIRLPQDLKERIEPPDEKAKVRKEKGKKPVGFSGGKQGGLSLLVRRLLHLYLGEQMPGEQWHLELDDSDPLRQMESRVYALEAAVYDEGRDLAADERTELETMQEELLEPAHQHAAGREPSFEQLLSLVLLGRVVALAEHLYQAGRK